MYTRVDIIGASASTAFYSKLVMSLKVIRTLTKKYGHIGVIFLREGIGREIGGHIIYRRLVECCAVGPPMFDAESFKPSRRHFNGCDTNTENLYPRFDRQTHDA